MTHNASHIIIHAASQPDVDNLPEDKQAKIQEILEKANKEVDKVMENNPNL